MASHAIHPVANSMRDSTAIVLQKRPGLFDRATTIGEAPRGPNVLPVRRDTASAVATMAKGSAKLTLAKSIDRNDISRDFCSPPQAAQTQGEGPNVSLARRPASWQRARVPGSRGPQ